MLMAISPKPSLKPYIHPAIREEECDLKWPKGNKIPLKVKAEKRRHQQKLACVGMVFTTTNAKIDWCMDYYDQEGMCVRPHPCMRSHIFNHDTPFRVPRMVTSPK